MDSQIAELLIDIEAQLRQLGQWDKVPPDADALASEQPFCVDTLRLPQWLQFVFWLARHFDAGGVARSASGLRDCADGRRILSRDRPF